MKDFTGGIHGAINRKPVSSADLEVFGAVTGCSMDRAGSLVERHVLGENTERIAFEKGVAEDRSLEPGAREPGDDPGIVPAKLFADCLEQFERDDVDIASNFSGDVLELGVKSDGDVGRDGPGRSGPDETVDFAAGEARIDQRRVGR